MKKKLINAMAKCMHVERVMCSTQDEKMNETSMKKSIWNCWLLFDFILMACLHKAHNYMNGVNAIDWWKCTLCFMACIAKQKMEQMYPCRYNIQEAMYSLLRHPT